jgi:hypothetical protein
MGIPRDGQHLFYAPYIEFEYGITGRWTTDLYLEGQSTSGDSSVFTCWRIENRFRPLKREHWINPVLYIEYENLNEASRILKETEGNAGISGERNSELAATPAHELETKLILSSNFHDWNVAENFIVEKNLSHNEGFEFGYARAFRGPWPDSHPAKSAGSAVRTSWPVSNSMVALAVQTASDSTRPLITWRR